MVKSIVWFDIESTGVSTATDRIIEICLIKTDLDGNRIATYETLVNPGPGIEIRPEAQEKHGISIEELQDFEEFKYFAPEIKEFIGDSHLGGYNAIRFDIPMLVEEFMRAGIVFDYRKRAIIDPFVIMRKMEPRDLGSVYKRLIGKDLDGAHRAAADIEATMEIFKHQRTQYDLPETLVEIDEVINDDKNSAVDLASKLIFKEIDGEHRIVFNFGKHKDIPFADVYKKDARYLNWIIDKGEFATETKLIVKKLTNILKKGMPFNY